MNTRVILPACLVALASLALTGCPPPIPYGIPAPPVLQPPMPPSPWPAIPDPWRNRGGGAPPPPQQAPAPQAPPPPSAPGMPGYVPR